MIIFILALGILAITFIVLYANVSILKAYSLRITSNEIVWFIFTLGRFGTSHFKFIGKN